MGVWPWLAAGGRAPLGKNCYDAVMSATSRVIASGPDWRVQDIRCTAGPSDRAFEERHDDVCVAIVTHGTFQYRTPLGSAVLGPGSLLLGEAGSCFECGHEHAAGDRCLSFHFAPEAFDALPAPHRGCEARALQRRGSRRIRP